MCIRWAQIQSQAVQPMPKRLVTGNARKLRTCFRRRSTRQVSYGAGFSLLELLVVLAIMVIAVTAFPLVLNRALPRRRVRAATEHIEAAIRRAEIQSTALDQPERISVEQLSSRLATSTHLRTTTPGGALLRALVVFPDGSTSGARFVLSDGPDRSTVLVSEITGRIHVEAR